VGEGIVVLPRDAPFDEVGEDTPVEEKDSQVSSGLDEEVVGNPYYEMASTPLDETGIP
jgi:hypothetical protein